MINACHHVTFSLHVKKKLSGSLPYEMADPTIGIQWNTSGGNEGSRGIICMQHVSRHASGGDYTLTSCLRMFNTMVRRGV